MAISYRLINGLYFDWSSVEINIDGDVVVGITEITFCGGLGAATPRGYPTPSPTSVSEGCKICE